MLADGVFYQYPNAAPRAWQAPLDELLLFPQADHDDLFDGLQTMMEEAVQFQSFDYPEGLSCISHCDVDYTPVSELEGW